MLFYNKVEIKQETKSDIQELFNELFLVELNNKIADFSSKTIESIEAVDNIHRQFKDNNMVIGDQIDELKNILKCIGTQTDWGDTTLVSFLNIISTMIKNCENKVDDLKGLYKETSEEWLGNKETLKDLNSKLMVMSTSVDSITSILSKSEELNNKSFLELSEDINKKCEFFDEKIENINLHNKRNLKYVMSALGIILVINIVFFIILFLK